MLNKKSVVLTLVIVLEIFVIAEILQTSLLTGEYALYEPNPDEGLSNYCEEARAIIDSYSEKFENEIFFRDIFPDEIIKYDENEPHFRDPGSYEYYYPDNFGKPVFWQMTINSDNFRGNEYEITKSNNTRRIILLGDSHTFGFGLNDNETFSFNLEKHLNDGSSNKNWEVLNLGHVDYNLIQKLQSLGIKGMKYNPDIVILQYDQDDIYPQRFRSYENELFLNLTLLLDDFGRMKNITDCRLWNDLDVLREKGFKEKFGEDKLINSMLIEPLNDLKMLQDNYNFSVIIISTWENYLDIKYVEEICQKNNWECISVNDEILEKKANLYFISKYETHFNSIAHLMIADYLYNIITQTWP